MAMAQFHVRHCLLYESLSCIEDTHNVFINTVHTNIHICKTYFVLVSELLVEDVLSECDFKGFSVADCVVRLFIIV